MIYQRFSLNKKKNYYKTFYFIKVISDNCWQISLNLACMRVFARCTLQYGVWWPVMLELHKKRKHGARPLPNLRCWIQKDR